MASPRVRGSAYTRPGRRGIPAPRRPRQSQGSRTDRTSCRRRSFLRVLLLGLVAGHPGQQLEPAHIELLGDASGRPLLLDRLALAELLVMRVVTNRGLG